MKEKSIGGERSSAGRPAAEEQRRTLKAQIKALGFSRSRKTGKLLEEAIENLYLLAKQPESFEVRLKNFVFKAVVNRRIFYGETVKELLGQIQEYDSADDVRRERYNRLDSMYEYGEFDGEITRPFL